MPIRFLFLWFCMSAVVFLIAFVFKKRERKLTFKVSRLIALSLIGGFFVILPLFFLNHLSGL